MAGTSVDIALFPLDTIKTRLQSADGFFKAGGFRGVYSGLSAAAAGSAPGGACVCPLVTLLVHAHFHDERNDTLRIALTPHGCRRHVL